MKGMPEVTPPLDAAEFALAGAGLCIKVPARFRRWQTIRLAPGQIRVPIEAPMMIAGDGA
jgi:hypothetical protein